MTDIVVITIPGEPTSKQRARFARRGSKMVAFTPTETRSAEQSVGYAFRAAAPGWTLDASHAFSVEATFYLGYFQRRDVDNMLKLVCDGLTGVAWADDSQVYDIAGHRRIDVDNPRTEVTIAITGDLEYPSKDCEHCGKRFRTYTSTVRVQRFCCRDCSLAWRRRRRTVECAHCGAPEEARMTSNGIVSGGLLVDDSDAHIVGPDPRPDTERSERGTYRFRFDFQEIS